MGKRNTAIDLFKCLLMIGICMRHSVNFSGMANGCEARLWSWAVPGFAFISGYYGVRFSGRKIVNLCVVAACSAVVPTVVALARGQGMSIYRECLLSNWYLNAYLVLILLSPIINGGLDVVKRMPALLVPLGVLLIWSWFSEQWGTRDWVFHLEGLGSMSFFALLFPYVLAWGYREFGLKKYLSSRRMVAIGLTSLGLMPFLGRNTSPITLAFVVVLFFVFEHIRVPAFLEKIVAFVLPSVFPIYLLHTNAVGFSFIHDYCALMTGDWELSRYVAFAICTLTLFVGCLLLDLPRRFCLWLLTKWNCHAEWLTANGGTKLKKEVI